MAINILINGASGRMGRIVVKAIESDAVFKLVGKTGREDNLSQAIRDSRAEIVIDFTTPETVYQNALTIIEENAHPLIGTTGLRASEIKKLKTLCYKKKLGGIIAPNFSIGAVLMMQLAKQAAKYFPYAEIIERHHENKLDAPSGTAVRTAQIISEVRKNTELPVPTEELYPAARGADVYSIPVHSIRLPGYLAQQEIVFGNLGETFTLSHATVNRECYVSGIVLACKKIDHLQELVYGLEAIL